MTSISTRQRNLNFRAFNSEQRVRMQKIDSHNHWKKHKVIVVKEIYKKKTSRHPKKLAGQV